MNALPPGLLPDNSDVVGGRLSIGGCDVVSLARELGTPLFVYDEDHLRSRCREARAVMGEGVAYAAKAFFCTAMARLVDEEGLYIDVASGGELHVALNAGVSASHLVFHGNNKSDDELTQALEAGVGRVVVDSFDELDRIERLVAGGASPPDVLIRATPGVEAHTHEYVRTGQLDSKFGFALEGGAALRAAERIEESGAMRLVGVHAHIGSQVFRLDSFTRAVEVLAPFVLSLDVEELSLGGGLGVAYVEGEAAPTLTDWGTAVIRACRDAGITARIIAEPGRSIAAAAAVTAYTVGTIKDLPGIRTYLSVDGGMSDNPRPVLYGSGYETFLPRAVDVQRPRRVTVVGKHCESGDLLVEEGWVPADTAVGDILCTPVTGAYGHSMGSNYNKVPRPAVVFVSGGDARVVVRRETYDDLLALDL